jgi:hypothetical protein
MVSIGSVINGGFRLFREQPLAVLAWGILYGVLTAASTVWLPTIMRAQMGEQLAGGSPASFLMWMIPFYLAMILIGLVMTAAAFRAVMLPEARAAAFLRFGGDELRLFVVALVWVAINLVLYVVMVLLLAMIVASVIAGSGGSSVGLAGVLGAVIALPILALMIFIHIRLSPAIPLTLLRRKIIIGDAWRLTKGHFWVLFTGYLVVVLMLALAYALVVAVTMGSYFATLAGGGFSPQSVELANQYRFEQMATITPWTVFGWVLSALYGAVAYALWAGSVGTATQDLLGLNTTDYATTFA